MLILRSWSWTNTQLIRDTPFCLLQWGIQTAKLKAARSDFLQIGLLAWILIFEQEYSAFQRGNLGAEVWEGLFSEMEMLQSVYGFCHKKCFPRMRLNCALGYWMWICWFKWSSLQLETGLSHHFPLLSNRCSLKKSNICIMVAEMQEGWKLSTNENHIK